MTAYTSSAPATAPQSREIDQIVSTHRGEPGDLLTTLEILQQQHRNNYLPRETLVDVARHMKLPLSQVFSVATFYAFFNLEPQGDHTVCVCRGTACHTRGSRVLLEYLKQTMGIESDPDEEERADKNSFTTRDRKFTIRTVACFGQCAMAPVVEMDHRIHGNMNRQSLGTALESIEREGDEK